MRSAGFAEKMSRRGALWGALLLLAAPVGCGAPDAQDDGAAQTALESLGGYLGADGRSGCTVDLDGGDRVCRSESEWQKVAELACPAHGLSLVAFKTFTDCGLGKHRNVAYACCPAATPTPPPPPPPAMCTTNKSSDPNVCLDLTAWKTKAAATCALAKQELSQYTLSSPCGMGSFSQIEFSCCPGKNPPPQPSCMTTKLGGANSCIDLSAWKTKASAYCSAAMLTLGNLTPTGACGMGLYNQVEVSCCGAANPNPNPNPNPCFVGQIAAANMCQSQAALKMTATGICSTKNYLLKDISYGATCASGNVEAKYTCCP